MKLTKTLREAFVNRVMGSLPNERSKIEDQIHKLLMDVAVDALPPAVRALWNDPALKPYVARSTCAAPDHRLNHAKDTYDGTWLDYGDRPSGVSIPGLAGNFSKRFSKATRVRVDNLIGEMQALKLQRKDLKGKLMGIASAAGTRKQLLEMLPEFEQYLPAETVVERQLPMITGVAQDFAAAGLKLKQVAEEVAA